MKSKSTLSKTVSWIARIIAAIIMLQTLWFKFNAAEESVFIFTTVGIEPWGRIMTGVMELVASILLMITPLAVFGALLTVGIMGGAILTHLTILGIEVKGDGGYLFFLALAVLACALVVLVQERQTLVDFLKTRQFKKSF